MRHRWSNTLLLVLVLAEGVTGVFGLASGSADRALINDLHAVLAYAILAVIGWKAALALRSLRRPRRGRPRYWSIILAALLLATLALGFWWSNGRYADVAGTSLMSIHIWLGIAIVPVILYHSWTYTARFRVGYSADRRAALRLMGALAAGAALWGVSEGFHTAASTPASRRRFTGSHERASYRGNAFPTTSWINDDPAPVNPADWILRVGGEVATPLELRLDDLRENGRFEVVDVTETLDCTGGWYSTQVWRGVRPADILAAAGITGGAQSVSFASVTGYTRRAPRSALDRYILATHVGGEPISHRHGAPLRLVAPGKRGFEWVKWITSITANTSPGWLQLPFPIE